MKPETRSKDSDRKWVLFVHCGTRYFIKPVYVRDILLQGPWAASKLIDKYGDTLWGDNKSYVIMLLLTATALQTKQRKQAERTCKEARVGVQIHMYTVNLLQKCLFPIPLSSVVSHKTGHWEGGHVQSIVPGVPDPVGCLSSTAVTSHTRGTSLFSGYEEPGRKTKGRDITCKISNTTHQEVDI